MEKVMVLLLGWPWQSCCLCGRLREQASLLQMIRVVHETAIYCRSEACSRKPRLALPAYSGITAITSISISHRGCPSADTTNPVEIGNTPLSHLPTSR